MPASTCMRPRGCVDAQACRGWRQCMRMPRARADLGSDWPPEHLASAEQPHWRMMCSRWAQLELHDAQPVPDSISTNRHLKERRDVDSPHAHTNTAAQLWATGALQYPPRLAFNPSTCTYASYSIEHVGWACCKCTCGTGFMLHPRISSFKRASADRENSTRFRSQ